jgi:hypothetical protein
LQGTDIPRDANVPISWWGPNIRKIPCFMDGILFWNSWNKSKFMLFGCL